MAFANFNPDQMIVLHQRVAEILGKMLSESQDELLQRRRQYAEHNEATRTHFHDIIARLGDVRTGVSEALFTLTDLVKVGVK